MAIAAPNRASFPSLCMRLAGVVALLAAAQACAPQGGPGGGTGIRLDRVQGGTVIGPGGSTNLSVQGYNTGPISWSLNPEGLGSFVVEPRMQGSLAASTPPPSTYLRGTFQAGPVPGVCDFIATADSQGVTYRSIAKLRIVQGIFLLPAEIQATLAPRNQREFIIQVVDPDYTGLVSQEMAWSPAADFADGSIVPASTGKLVLSAPSVPGHYLIQGRAVADPHATIQVRITIQAP